MLSGRRAALLLTLAALAPLFLAVVLMWAPANGVATATPAWVLCLYATGILAFVATMRVRSLRRREGRTDARTALLSMGPTLIAVLACCAVSAIGFRWTIAVLMAAFTTQGLWDFAGDSLPLAFRIARPAVSIGALAALLGGFMAS